MTYKKNNFTLLELLIVIAIVGILITILMPSLRNARENAYNAICLSNLKQLGAVTQLHINDNSGRIPSHSFFYKDDEITGHEDESDLFTGEQEFNASLRGSFWAKENLGQYLFPEGTSDYSKHAIYACPSSTITHNTSTGEKVDNMLSYYVNTHVDINNESPWANNWGITDARPVYWTNIASLYQPDKLMSIYDCAQGWNGRVQASGAGGFISHGPDIWDNPDPGPWSTSPPERLIGRKLRPAQDGVEYWRGGVDFKHNRESLNSVFFDGHAAKLFNGFIQNQNVINQ